MLVYVLLCYTTSVPPRVDLGTSLPVLCFGGGADLLAISEEELSAPLLLTAAGDVGVSVLELSSRPIRALLAAVPPSRAELSQSVSLPPSLNWSSPSLLS